MRSEIQQNDCGNGDSTSDQLKKLNLHHKIKALMSKIKKEHDEIDHAAADHYNELTTEQKTELKNAYPEKYSLIEYLKKNAHDKLANPEKTADSVEKLSDTLGTLANEQEQLSHVIEILRINPYLYLLSPVSYTINGQMLALLHNHQIIADTEEILAALHGEKMRFLFPETSAAVGLQHSEIDPKQIVELQKGLLERWGEKENFKEAIGAHLKTLNKPEDAVKLLKWMLDLRKKIKTATRNACEKSPLINSCAHPDDTSEIETEFSQGEFRAHIAQPLRDFNMVDLNRRFSCLLPFLLKEVKEKKEMTPIKDQQKESEQQAKQHPQGLCRHPIVIPTIILATLATLTLTLAMHASSVVCIGMIIAAAIMFVTIIALNYNAIFSKDKTHDIKPPIVYP